MQALTKLNPTDPVRFDRMNTILGEIEGRDEDLLNKINELSEADVDLLDKINDLKEASTAFKAFPKTTKLYEVTESGIYLTPNSGIEDYPEGWTQSRHLLIVFNCGNPSYSGQIIMPYRTAPSPKKMAFRVCLAEGSKWDEVFTTTTITLDLPVASNFVNYNGSSYVKKTNNVIEVAIGIKRSDEQTFGNNTTIATLPVGYRPVNNITFALRGIPTTSSNGLPCYALISNKGNIVLRCDSSFKEVQGTVTFTI